MRLRTWGTSTPAASLQEHRKAFQQMWLHFLTHQVGRWGGTQGRAPVWGSRDGEAGTLTCCFPQLPLCVCKKVLVIMHDSILPHLAQPSLMIDFLTRAYDIGEQEMPGGPRAGPGMGWCFAFLDAGIQQG